MNVTNADSIVMPIGTEKEIKVSDVMKYASISQPTLDAIQGGITQKAQDADADVAFARFEVGYRHADEKGGLRPTNGTLHDHGVASSDDDVDSDDESDEDLMRAIDDEEQRRAITTNVGDSIGGQRQLEQARYGSKRETNYSTLAGNKVKRMSDKEARKVVKRALADKRTKFVWHPTHRKKMGSDSGRRYEIYSQKVLTYKDYQRYSKERIPGMTKNVIVRADLVNDVAVGALTFQLHPRLTEVEDGRRGAEFIQGSTPGVIHRVLTLQPRTTNVDEDVIYQLWKRSTNTVLSVRQMEFLSNAVFRVRKLNDNGPPTYEVKNLREALESEHWESHWKPACLKEIEGLEQRGVWTRVSRSSVPKGSKVVGSRLVFKIKVDSDNSFLKAKARLVFRGDQSRHNRDFFETSSHMLSSTSLKMMLSLSAGEWGAAVEEAISNGLPRGEAHDLCECFKMHSIDVSQAYIRASWPPGHPDLYMELPSLDGSNLRNEYVAKMSRLLYGIPSAGRVWERYLDQFLRESLSARPLVGDRSLYKILFYRGQDGLLTTTQPKEQRGGEGGSREPDAFVIAGTFVDDIGYWGSSNEAVETFRATFVTKFGEDGITGGDVAETMLGMKVGYDDLELSATMSMPGFIDAMVERFERCPGMRCPRTPLPTTHEDKKYEGPLDMGRKRLFQQIVGSLTWASHQARPESMIASSILASHCQNPGPEHIDLAMHAVRYLRGTKERGIKFHGSSAVLDKGFPHRNKLDSMVDANLGADAFSEHSRSCYVIMLNGGVICMKVLKQTVVARSTGHSEMIALALLAQKIQACRDILAELGYLTGSTRVLEDNQAVCQQAGGDHQAAKSAHYRRDQAYVDEAVNAAKIYVDKVPSKLNCSDLGTKAVAPVELFELLRDRMTGYDADTFVSHTVQEALNGVLTVQPEHGALVLSTIGDGAGLVNHGTWVTKKGATKPAPQDT